MTMHDHIIRIVLGISKDYSTLVSSPWDKIGPVDRDFEILAKK